MLLFLLFFAAFVVMTIPARGGTVAAALRYDPARLLRTLVIISAALWLLPLFAHREGTNYAWFGLYFGAALISVWTLAAGCNYRIPNVLGIATPRSAFYLLLVGSLPYVAYHILGGGFMENLNAAMTASIADLRIDQWEKFEAGGDRVEMVLACIAFPAAHVWPLRSPRSPVFWYSLALLAVLMINAAAAGAARTNVVFSLGLCYFLLHTKYNLRPMTLIRKRPFLFAGLLLTFIGLNYYIFYFVMAERVPEMAVQYERMSMHVMGSSPTGFLRWLNGETAGVAGVVAISAGYFSSPLTFFEMFMSGKEICNCIPQLGVYNFPFVDSVVGNDWFEIRKSIGQFWRLHGVGENPWATAYRDWIIDFGVLGSLLFNAVLMFSLGVTIRNAASRTDDLARLVSAFCVTFLLVTPMLSPLLLQFVSLPLYGLLIVYSVTRPDRAANKSTRPRASTSTRFSKGGVRPVRPRILTDRFARRPT